MIYAMSDIHGYLDILKRNMDLIHFRPETDRLILLGDYIDYGPESGQTLHYIYALQREYGEDRVVCLKGNHEAMLLEWLKIYQNANYNSADHFYDYSDWLLNDSDADFITFRTLVTVRQYEVFEMVAKKASALTCNIEAARLVAEENEELIRWLKNLPVYYEKEHAIYVHAGIDEEAGDLWKIGTEESVFLWKFPPTKGHFIKTIIAGHTGTGSRYLANDRDYHDIYYDGESHYFIDGSTCNSGSIPILAYDEWEGEYYSIDQSGNRRRII